VRRNFLINKPLFWLKDRIDAASRNRRAVLLVFIGLMLVLYFGINYRRIFFMALLTILGSASLLYVRYFKEAYVLGVELVTFAAIMTGYAYGSGAGATVGFVAIFFSQVLSGRFKYSTIISIVMVPIIGFAAAFTTFLPITTAGLILVVIYDLVTLPLYMLLGSRLISSAIYFITHMLFVYWMFSEVAPFLIKIM